MSNNQNKFQLEKFAELLTEAERGGLFEKNPEFKKHLDLAGGKTDILVERMYPNDINATLTDHTFLGCLGLGDDMLETLKNMVVFDELNERIEYLWKKVKLTRL